MPSSSRTGRPALAILAEADAATRGMTCEASTECCRFGITGREPYLTRAEWELMVKEVKRQGRRMPALSDDDDEDERCPFLSPEGRCRIYAARPLGCRTFFCERARGPDGGALILDRRAMNALAQELAAISGDKGRPLRSWLRAR
jgi:uncharacterized protein